jgi:hypothetical protein
MNVDKHIGHCLVTHSANCTEIAQCVNSSRSFVLQIWPEAWKTQTHSSQFCSRHDGRLEPSASPLRCFEKAQNTLPPADNVAQCKFPVSISH